MMLSGGRMQMRPPDFLCMVADVSRFLHKFVFWQN